MDNQNTENETQSENREEFNKAPLSEPVDSPSSPPASGNTTPPASEKPKKKLSKRSKVLLAILVIIAAAAGGWFLYQQQNKKEVVETTEAPKQEIVKKEVGGNTFFERPKELKDPGFTLFADPEDYFGSTCDEKGKNCKPNTTEKDIQYFQVGETPEGGAIIVAGVFESKSVDMSTIELVVVQRNDTYEVLALHNYRYNPDNNVGIGDWSQEQVLGELRDAIHPSVKVNGTDYLAELSFPNEVTIDEQNIENTDRSPSPITQWALLTSSIAEVEKDTKSKLNELQEQDGKVYYQSVTDKGSYDTVKYYAFINEVFQSSYTLRHDLATNNTPPVVVTWDDGSKRQPDYSQGPAGCGSSYSYMRASGINIQDLEQIGTTNNGVLIYKLPITTELFDVVYKEYAEFDKDNKLGDKLDGLSKQQFSDKHMAVLTDDGAGAAVLHVDMAAFPRGGCGKPVVYLYPTEPTSVNVAVGADVVMSEPLYPTGGWKNVSAQPSGQLSYQNKNYESLYWEGYGHGPYPEITRGSVVRSSKAAATIESQLRQQGLHAKEIADFMEFWEPRLPDTPYTRLTWLTKNEIDRLAPLTVSPQPQTSIRVFLDFEGLEKPILLPKQRLVQFERKGFTLVEWGGLLRDGIPQ